MVNYEEAAEHWQAREKDAVRMPEAELRAAMEKFVASHRVCALACASSNGSLVRNTPIEYEWFDGAFWMISEGGLKFRALATNKRVCLAIFDPDPTFGHLAGMQVTGVAEVLEPFGPDYLAACEYKGIPAERLRALPFTMMVIRVQPTRVDMLCSAFKDGGYDVRQWLEL
jgi:hypothetical protein